MQPAGSRKCFEKWYNENLKNWGFLCTSEPANNTLSRVFFGEKSYALERLLERSSEIPDRCFVPAIPSPLLFFLRLDEARLLQDRHVMGNGRLGEMDARLNVGGAQPMFPACAGAFEFKSFQNTAAGGVGNDLQDAVEGVFFGGHD